MCQTYALPTNQQMRDWISYAAKLTDSNDIASKVTIEWSNRMTRARGMAYFNRNHLKFSVVLMGRSSLDEQKQCCVHEYLHLVAFHKHKDNGHGFWWKRLMNMCGFEARRCHNIDRTGIARTKIKIELKCSCRTHQVTQTIIKRIKSGKIYRCLYCKNNLSIESIPAGV